MTKINAFLISALIFGFPGISWAQQDGSFIPPPINPLSKRTKWAPPSATPGPVRAENPMSPTTSKRGQPAPEKSRRDAAAPPPGASKARKAGKAASPKALEGVLHRLSEDDLRRWPTLLIKRAERAPWLKQFRIANKRPPVIKVAEFINRTTHHINAALASGAAGALINASTKLELASKTRAADFLLLGHIIAMDDAHGQTTLRSTLLALSLIHIETGEKVWIDMLLHRRLITLEKDGPTVRRLGPKEMVDLSGDFNDTDALEVTRQLRKQLREDRWLRQPGEKVVRLGPLRNRSSQSINERFISLIMERALLNSPRVRLLGRYEEADLAREERRRQVTAALSPAQRQELGSTHVVSGWIASEIYRSPSETIYQYIVTMEAIQTETSQKDWMAVSKVKKVVEAPKKHGPRGKPRSQR